MEYVYTQVDILRSYLAEPMNYMILFQALFCLWFGGLSLGALAGQYQVVTEDWAPYNFLQNNRLTGMATDVVRAIMARTGDNFEIVLLPSMRSIRTLNKRPKTVMYSLFRTAEREPLYKWVGPLAEVSIFPYQLANAPEKVNSMSQLLAAPKITTRNAGLIPAWLEAKGFKNLDKSAGDSVQLYHMLLAGRTDIIIGDGTAGVAYYSHQLGIAPDTLRQIPLELYRSSLYIAFSRDADDQVVASWAAALEQLRVSGELERIQNIYEAKPSP